MSDLHFSDCATHNMPALPNGACNCDLPRLLDALKDPIERAVYEAWGCCRSPSDAMAYVLEALDRLKL